MTLDQLVSAIKVLFPAALRTNDYTVAVVDGIASIVAWNSALGVQPTPAQLTAALSSLQLEDARQQQLQTLAAAYKSAQATSVSYMGSMFAADPESQQIFAHALVIYNAVGSVPTGFFTADVNGAKVPMTLTQLQGLGAAIAAQVWGSFQQWVAVRETLAAATTIPQIQAVVWAPATS